MINKLFFVLGVLVLNLSSSLNAQVVAVINRADWCHVCEANGARIMHEIMPEYGMGKVEFVVNDLTNDKTKEQSMMKLEKAGVWKLVEKEKMTGNIVLIDKRKASEISRISVSKSNAEINMAINEAIQTIQKK